MISLLASKSCEKRSKGIEQTWSARGDGKFAANAATPLQHASAGDSPPTTLLYFSRSYTNTNTWLKVSNQDVHEQRAAVKSEVAIERPTTISITQETQQQLTLSLDR